MTVRLHRCGLTWLKTDTHPCWRVEKALQEAGIEYEIVTEPKLARTRREDVIEHTGQNLLPAIEFEDGTILREESGELAARIAENRLAIPDAARDSSRFASDGTRARTP